MKLAPVKPLVPFMYESEIKLRKCFHNMANLILENGFYYEENQYACQSYISYQIFEGDTGLVYREIHVAEESQFSHTSVFEVFYTDKKLHLHSNALDLSDDLDLNEFVKDAGNLNVYVRHFNEFDGVDDVITQYLLDDEEVESLLNGKEISDIVAEIEEQRDDFI